MNTESQNLISSSRDLGAIVRAERRRLGLRQADLAKIAGTGRRFLSELENGKPSLEIGKIMLVLNSLSLKLNCGLAAESQTEKMNF